MQQTDRRQTKALLNASALWGQRHNNKDSLYCGQSSEPSSFVGDCYHVTYW